MYGFFFLIHTESNLPKKLFIDRPIPITSFATHLENGRQNHNECAMIFFFCISIEKKNYLWSAKPFDLRHWNKLLIFFIIFSWISCHIACVLYSSARLSIVSTTHCIFSIKAFWVGFVAPDTLTIVNKTTQNITHFILK